MQTNCIYIHLLLVKTKKHKVVHRKTLMLNLDTTHEFSNYFFFLLIIQRRNRRDSKTIEQSSTYANTNEN